MRFTKARVLATLEVWWLRLRFLLIRTTTFLGIGMAFFGGYLIIQPGETFAPHSTIIESLPTVQGFTQADGIIFIVAGAVVVYLTTRT